MQFEEEKSSIHYINVKEPKTYEAFLDNLNDLLFLPNTTFSDLLKNFTCFSLFKFSPLYVRLKFKSNWKEELKQIILKRYSEFERKKVGEGSSFQLISDLKDEVSAISPVIDEEFNNEISTIFNELKSEGNKKNRDVYEKELLNSSQIYLDYLKDKINSKFYWTEEQMDLMLNTYVDFMKEEFLDIIKLNSTEQIYNMIYEDNYDIFETRIKEDKVKINEMFKSFIDKINTKKNPKEQDIKEDIKKGANYAMKETENLREVKVTVQINQDLKSEIEQDF